MSLSEFNAFMNRTSFERAAAKMATRVGESFIDDMERMRDDAGLSVAALATAAGIAPQYLRRIIAGEAEPSAVVRARLAVVLGADLSLRLYPNTGPAIRDRHQARIAEALLAAYHPRYRAFTELAVRRPSRGWIDLAFHDPVAALLIATEIQSELRRIEQLVRWAAEKADSLPSWDGWTRLPTEPTISRLLVVRRTRATRAVAADAAGQLRIAYPAHPEDAVAALTGASTPWPGPALVWAEVTASGARLLPGR